MKNGYLKPWSSGHDCVLCLWAEAAGLPTNKYITHRFPYHNLNNIPSAESYNRVVNFSRELQIRENAEVGRLVTA